jgi:hypothetical protein
LCYQALNVGQGVVEKRLVRIEWVAVNCTAGLAILMSRGVAAIGATAMTLTPTIAIPEVT